MTPEKLKEAESNLRDPLWRMNNLYYIIDKEGVRKRFQMNWAQKELYDNLWYCNIVLKARQLGISTFVGLLYLDRCLFNSNCSAGLIAHTREDAEMFFRRIKFAYENLPGELKKSRIVDMDNARELKFNNGSILRTGTSMRGSTLQYLHISEFGKICNKYTEKAREIISGSLNTLSAGQYVIIESTAEGREGYFYDMCKEAQDLQQAKKTLSKLDFRFFFFPWWKHPEYKLEPELIPIQQDLREYFNNIKTNDKINLRADQEAWYAKKYVTQGLDMKREFPSTPEEAFASANEGLYYGAQITKARNEKRISRITHDESLPVYTAWDLGISDSTAIWFYQIAGKEIHLIEYYENSGEALTHYLKFIKDRPYNYLKHFLPHDAGAREYSTGFTRVETAAKHGITFTISKELSVIEGIDAVRNLLNRCWFDEEKCSSGIKALESYRRGWNESLGCWREDPVHNAASHGSDAFRILAVSLYLAKPGMSPEELNDLRNKAYSSTNQYSSTAKLPPIDPFRFRS